MSTVLVQAHDDLASCVWPWFGLVVAVEKVRIIKGKLEDPLQAQALWMEGGGENMKQNLQKNYDNDNNTNDEHGLSSLVHDAQQPTDTHTDDIREPESTAFAAQEQDADNRFEEDEEGCSDRGFVTDAQRLPKLAADNDTNSSNNKNDNNSNSSNNNNSSNSKLPLNEVEVVSVGVDALRV